MKPRLSRAHGIVLGLALAAVASLLLARFALEPDARGHGTHEQLGLVACPTMRLFDVPCPGCGVTTAVALVTRGQLVAAFLTQPFGALLALAGAAFALWVGAHQLRGKDAALALARLRPWRAWPLAVGIVLLSWGYKAATHLGWLG